MKIWKHWTTMAANWAKYFILYIWLTDHALNLTHNWFVQLLNWMAMNSCCWIRSELGYYSTLWSELNEIVFFSGSSTIKFRWLLKNLIFKIIGLDDICHGLVLSETSNGWADFFFKFIRQSIFEIKYSIGFRKMSQLFLFFSCERKNRQFHCKFTVWLYLFVLKDCDRNLFNKNKIIVHNKLFFGIRFDEFY